MSISEKQEVSLTPREGQTSIISHPNREVKQFTDALVPHLEVGEAESHIDDMGHAL